jgi:hypothetical protein
MAKKSKIQERSYDEALRFLRDRGFEILNAPGAAGRVVVRKLNCAAALTKTAGGGVQLYAKPGYVIGGEISKLIDKGFQKFLHTTKIELPATADHLKAIHQFSEEVREAMGATSLYNESLGTVSDRYVYDRVKGREPGEAPTGQHH